MLNQVILIGNLGKDPELKFVKDTAVCNLRIATSRAWTGKDGNKVEETEWHDVEVWGKQGEACGKHLTKGRQVCIQGRIKTDKWQDKETGKDRYRVKIIAENVRFLGGGKANGDKPDEAQPDTAPADDPF